MSTIISTVFIAVPPAFLLGWILSKALFRHISLTGPNTTFRDAASVPAVAAKVAANENDKGDATAAGKHNDAQIAATKDNGRTLNSLRKKLAGARANTQSMQSEIQLLKEAAAEREHAVIDLKRKLQIQLALPEEKIGSVPANQKQFIKMMEDRQAIYELRAEELSQELAAANARASRTTQRFQNWRQKIKPMAKQFRQQRAMINELREELGRQEMQQHGQEDAEIAHQKATSVQAIEKLRGSGWIDSHSVQEEQVALSSGLVTKSTIASASVETDTDVSVQVSQEDLQKLRGVGPAMHEKLNNQGVYRLKQLALMSSQELTELGTSLGIGKQTLAKHQWTLQARQLLNMPEVVVGTAITGCEAIPA
jgi:predicted flap endonuclease-1-like 5' DNA nuclease